ncbi:MAG: EFR1 family ferrodoxin [Lachnospiraceae bacterium]|nr:EFR1 family ferrodoxin [Lachnospiraceae bacterium]
MIIVFSGTGNSRYIADMLGDLLNDEVVSANDYIRRRKATTFKSEKPFIFVSPVYVSAPPLVFTAFLEKCRFTGSKKAYFICTCAGGMGASPYYWSAFAKKMGLEDCGTNQIIMPQNYIIYFKTKREEINDVLIQRAAPKVLNIAQKIIAGKPLEPSGMKKWEIIATRPIVKPYYKLFMKTDKFYASDACISCGKCEKVCPLGNIRLKDGQPVWGKTCTHCMACINYCPTAAIQYGKLTWGKPRYKGPGVHCNTIDTIM